MLFADRRIWFEHSKIDGNIYYDGWFCRAASHRRPDNKLIFFCFVTFCNCTAHVYNVHDSQHIIYFILLLWCLYHSARRQNKNTVFVHCHRRAKLFPSLYVISSTVRARARVIFSCLSWEFSLKLTKKQQKSMYFMKTLRWRLCKGTDAPTLRRSDTYNTRSALTCKNVSEKLEGIILTCYSSTHTPFSHLPDIAFHRDKSVWCALAEAHIGHVKSDCK